MIANQANVTVFNLPKVVFVLICIENLQPVSERLRIISMLLVKFHFHCK